MVTCDHLETKPCHRYNQVWFSGDGILVLRQTQQGQLAILNECLDDFNFNLVLLGYQTNQS